MDDADLERTSRRASREYVPDLPGPEKERERAAVIMLLAAHLWRTTILNFSPGKTFTEPLFVAILLILTGGIASLRTAFRRAIGWWNVISALLLWAISTVALSRVMIHSLLIPDQPGSPAVIVVASGGASRLFGSTTDVRLAAGIDWWKQNRRAELILAGADESASGQLNDWLLQRMKAEAVARGVPAASILLDDRSRNTREHAMQLSLRAGITRDTPVGLVTSSWHLRRMRMSFQPFFRRIFTRAADDGGATARSGFSSFLPSADGLFATTVAVHEWLGMAWYALRS